jgi:LDH2 family malate/lactate/ureidoglycolate dehydrogenase
MNNSKDVIEYVVSPKEAREFVIKCMKTIGTSIDHAGQLADLLLDADLVGHYSHGLNRLHIYIDDLLNGVQVDGTPKVIKQKGGTAWVDGSNLLGAVVGNFCTELAIKLAKEFGVSWVVTNNSNHFGTCQYYTKQIANAGLVGMSFTNTSPIMFPDRSSEKALGTNPLSCCANSEKTGDSFILDIATTTVAFGKIELANCRGKKQIPLAWGADTKGNPSTETEIVLKGGLLPLGGIEESGSYKGTGLAMMGELFCGILGGAAFGKNIRLWGQTHKPANLGQCFVAVDPDCFAPGFAPRLQQFLDETRNLKPVSQDKPVLVPGDLERMNTEYNQKSGGLIYQEGQIKALNVRK